MKQNQANQTSQRKRAPKKRLRLKLERKQAKTTRSIRFSPDEESVIQAKADTLTGGDFSAYVRYASLNFTPKRTDLETSP